MGFHSNCNHKLVLAAIIFSGVLFLCVAGEVEKENGLYADWEPPSELGKMYPYVVSGYDKEGSPVWVIEAGKWDIRYTMEKGGDIVEDFHKFTGYYIEKMYDSPSEYNTSRKDFVVILDMEYFAYSQYCHLPTVWKYLNVTQQFAEEERYRENSTLKQAIIVNANYFFNKLYSMARAVLGEVAAKYEVYGTDPNEWRPILLQKIDKDQLPEKLGGHETHIPVKVYN